MYLGQQQDHASRPARNSTPTGQPQRNQSGVGAFSRQRGTTRSRRLADRSCCREATQEAGWQKSIRYCGDWPCWQLYTMTPQLVCDLLGYISASRCAGAATSHVGRPQVAMLSQLPTFSRKTCLYR